MREDVEARRRHFVGTLDESPERALRRYAGVPEWLAKETARQVLRQPIVGFVQGLPANEGFYFWGSECGSGKSLAMAHLCLRHLAAAACNPDITWTRNDLYGERYLPVWVNMTRLLESLRDGYDTKRKESELLRPYREAPVLLLDDLGVTDRDHERLVLYAILEYRSRDRITCATGNFGPDELARQFDDRIASRLLGLMNPVHVRPEESNGRKIDYRVHR